MEPQGRGFEMNEGDILLGWLFFHLENVDEIFAMCIKKDSLWRCFVPPNSYIGHIRELF